MGRQGEGGGLKILKNEETSFMDDPKATIFLELFFHGSFNKDLVSTGL